MGSRHLTTRRRHVSMGEPISDETDRLMRSLVGRTIPGPALIVDDHPRNIEFLSHALEALGVPFDTAADGLEAVARLACRDYAFMLLDYHMPKLDGLKVLAWLHNSAGRPPRVMVLTSDQSEETEAMFRALGCGAYLHKPLTLPAFYEQLARLLD